MAEAKRYGPDDYWKCMPPHYAKNFEPHWAVKIYLDPRGAFNKDTIKHHTTNAFEAIAEQERIDRALCFFDMEFPGWVPKWFPVEAKGRSLSPWARLAWFNHAMTERCDPGSLSSKTWDEKQSAVAFALIELYELPRHGAIPVFVR